MAEATKGRKPKEQYRGHGEGSIYQRPDETWAGVSRYIDPETGKKSKHFVYGKTRKEVVAKKDAWEEDFKKGMLPSKAKMTVGQWLDDWLKTYAKIRVRQNTYETYELIVEKHLKPSLGEWILRDLRPEQVQKLLNERLVSGNLRTKGPLSPRRVEYIYVTLHCALDQAVKNQLVIRNVCDSVDKPKKSKHEFMPWTTQQTNQFLASVKGARLFPLYLVAWGAGLRRSEILGLQWPDINYKKGTLTVNRALVRVKREKGKKPAYKIQEPKTKKSRRTIPLPGSVMAELKEWKKRQNIESVAFAGVYNSLNLVFCNEAGQPFNPDFISRQFKADLGLAKLPAIRFHDLRHGHATQLLEMGEDLKVISDRLGHSTITLTADTYSHVREKLQKDASKKLEKVLNLNK